jgi:hypothetical protein
VIKKSIKIELKLVITSKNVILIYILIDNKYRLKRTWQERVSRGDPFYVRLADTILKDVRRTDRHMKFLKSKNFPNLFLFISPMFRKETNSIQYNDDL